MIATVCLLPKLHLTGDSITDFPFHIIKVQLYPTLVNEPANPVGAMVVRIMKMIPDEVGDIGLALLGLSVNVEVGDGHGIGVQFPQRNVLNCKNFVSKKSWSYSKNIWEYKNKGLLQRKNYSEKPLFYIIFRLKNYFKSLVVIW